jgi:hypothetical protein
MNVMDSSTAVAIAITLEADRICGGDAPNEIVVMCVCCLWEQDPRGDWSTHRASDTAECCLCVDARRWREGMCFVVRPRRSNNANV